MAEVAVDQGRLRGEVCTGVDGPYLAFKGIPYAAPPVGNLRFKPPQQPAAWQGTREARTHGPVCPQYDDRRGVLLPGNEDCLYLNVYTAELTPPRPVMVWIHGGAYYTGSGDSDYYGPDFLVRRDVVLVTFNYRLEVLGFLCLDTEAAPGNLGLKDQVAALQWVARNIAAFGGDPQQVTLFGCSAGAACVALHLVSPRSRGLFQRAICQSGCCLNDWSYNVHARRRAFQLGKLLGADTDDPDQLLAFLATQPVDKLVKVQLPHLPDHDYDLCDTIFFGPVIEKADLRVEHFLCENPVDVVLSGRLTRMPLLVGCTSGDGIEIARSLDLPEYLARVGSLVPRELKRREPQARVAELDAHIRMHYFGTTGKIDVDLTRNKQLIGFYTDAHFEYNVVRMGRAAAAAGAAVFLYRFCAESGRNIVKQRYGMAAVRGVCHGDDLPYLFHVPGAPLGAQERAAIQHIVTIWTDFAKTGNPAAGLGAAWPAVSRDQLFCMDIHNISVSPRPTLPAVPFWDSLYCDQLRAKPSQS